LKDKREKELYRYEKVKNAKKRSESVPKSSRNFFREDFLVWRAVFHWKMVFQERGCILEKKTERNVI